MENNWQKQLMTVDEGMLEHAKAKGKRGNSSITVRRYLFWMADGRGPLKSTLNRSKGCVALTRLTRGV